MGCNFSRANATIKLSIKGDTKINPINNTNISVTSKSKNNINKQKNNNQTETNHSPKKSSPLRKKDLLTENKDNKDNDLLSKTSKSKSIKYDIMNPHNTKRSITNEKSKIAFNSFNKKDPRAVSSGQKDFRSFILTYSKASRTEQFTIKCFKQKFVDYMKAKYNLKIDLSTTVLTDNTVLYSILKDYNESFDNKYINLFCCTNIKMKNGNQSILSNTKQSLNKSGLSYKSSANSSKNNNNINNLNGLTNIKTKRHSSIESLSMKNIKTNNYSSYNNYNNPSYISNKISSSKINTSNMNSEIDDYNNYDDFDNSDESSDSIDYEFSNLLLVGTSDKTSKYYLNSLTKIADNENKENLNQDFDRIFYNMNNTTKISRVSRLSKSTYKSINSMLNNNLNAIKNKNSSSDNSNNKLYNLSIAGKLGSSGILGNFENNSDNNSNNKKNLVKNINSVIFNKINSSSNVNNK